VVDQFADLAVRIHSQNTDIFKQFWNVDQYARLVEPRPEETCRDAIIEAMKPSLSALGVIIEPEAHMAADKRGDISFAMPGRKILCELKRDYHANLWTAATEQLDRFYTHDPEANGFGIYTVLWFGEKRTSAIPGHPAQLPTPNSPADLAGMLHDLIPVDRRTRLTVIVIDVTSPPK
jgi:hypothetical protein